MGKTKTQIDKKSDDKSKPVSKGSSADKPLQPRGKQDTPVRTLASDQDKAKVSRAKHDKQQAAQKKVAPKPIETKENKQGQPHKPEVSTPVADLPVDAEPQRDGSFTFTEKNIQFTIKPDRTAKVRQTNTYPYIQTHYPTYNPKTDLDANGRITKLEPGRPTSVTITTTYKRGEKSTDKSAYGRGTTPADIKAGHTTMGFHEGQHGVDAVDFVRANPLPVFQGHVGMTVPAFNKATADYKLAVDAYVAALYEYTHKRTDCVGTPADDC